MRPPKPLARISRHSTLIKRSSSSSLTRQELHVSKMSALRSGLLKGTAGRYLPGASGSFRVGSSRAPRITVVPPRARSFSSLVPKLLSCPRREFSSLSWHDEADALSLSERQEGFLLERLHPSLTEEDIASVLRQGLAHDISPNTQVRSSDILLMRSRLGRSTGRALIKCAEPCAHAVNLFKGLMGSCTGSESPAFHSGKITSQEQLFTGEENENESAPTYRPMDRHDMRLFVEQCEAYVRFSEDLRRLAGADLNYSEDSLLLREGTEKVEDPKEFCGRRNENFLRVVTIHNVPRAYGRADLAWAIEQAVNKESEGEGEAVSAGTLNPVAVDTPENSTPTDEPSFPKPCSNLLDNEANLIGGTNSYHGGVGYKIKIPAKNVVFTFKRYGQQSDEAYILLRSQAEAEKVLSRVQEVAVPKHAKYETLFGCSFLSATRSGLFLQNSELDFETGCESKYQIVTSGWDKDMSADEFHTFLNQLKFFPDKVGLRDY